MSTPNRGKKVINKTSDKSPKNFQWAQPYEDTLIDILVREARKGNRPDSSFTATAFRNVVTNFNRIHGTCIMKKHVLSRIKTMKQHFNQFHGAFAGLSGFAWNPETKMFQVEDCVWEQRIQKNHKLEKLRDKPCHNWDTLQELYVDTRATGSLANGLRERSNTIQRGLNFAELCIDSQDIFVGVTAPNESSSYGDHNFSKAMPPLVGTPTVSSTQQFDGSNTLKLKRKASLISVMEDGYNTMAASIHELSMAFVETWTKVAGSKYDPRQNEEIYGAVDSLNLDEEYKVKCYCYLTTHPSKAAQITGAPTSVQGKLLDAIMKGSGEE